MSKARRHHLWVVVLILTVIHPPAATSEAQERSIQSAPKTGASTISLEKLPDILAEGATKLQSNIIALRHQQQSGEQTLKSLIKEREDLQAWIAALNASMAVNELTLAAAREAAAKLNEEEKQTGIRLREFTREHEIMGERIQEHGNSLAAVEEQVTELARSHHPLHSSKELQNAYRTYKQLGQDYRAAAELYRETLANSAESLLSSMKLITETKTKLEQDYLEKALKQELLKRQSPEHRMREIGQILLTLAALPGRAHSWMVEVFQSGALFRLLRENWANLTGLFLLLVLLGAGAIRFEKLVLPRLSAWQAQVREVSSKVLLTFLQILMMRLLSLGFVAWLYVAFLTVGIITNRAAWLVWSLTATLVTLRLALNLLHRYLAGEEADGIIPVPGSLAGFFRRHLSLMAVFVFLLRFFIMPNAGILGLTPEDIGSLKSLFHVVLLGWFLWLMRRSHLDPFLMVLPVPAFVKSRGFLRALRITGFLLFAFVVVSGLLGLKFLFEYAAQGAVFTLVVLTVAWLLGEGTHTLLRLTLHPEAGVLAKRFPDRERLFLKSYEFTSRTLWVGLAGVALLVSLRAWGISSAQLSWAFKWLSWGPSLGPIQLKPLNIGLTIAVIYLGFRLSRVLRTFMELKFYPGRDWDPGLQYSVSMSLHYITLVITALIALNTMGISLASLALVAGGLGVGIGFGLQNIVSNFLSGLILLFERPIKVGDMLVIDGQWGMVKEIRVRSTIFQTFDRYSLIIPNSELISGKILNWTYGGWGINRLTLKVGVSYSSDPLQVTQILEEVCRGNPRVLDDPPPQIFFEAYGDSSLNFNIWAYLATPSDRIPATHELNSAIFQAFQTHGVEIPFPQQDLHVRSWSRNAVPAMYIPEEKSKEKEDT